MKKKVPVRLGSHGSRVWHLVWRFCQRAVWLNFHRVSQNVVPMQRALLGQDADLTVAAGKTVSVNTYAPLIKDAAAGDAKLYVNNANAPQIGKGRFGSHYPDARCGDQNNQRHQFRRSQQHKRRWSVREMTVVTAVTPSTTSSRWIPRAGALGLKNGYRSAAHTRGSGSAVQQRNGRSDGEK